MDECPDVVEADDDEAVSAPATPPAPTAPDSVALPGGHSLDATACDGLLRQRGGIVVGLVAGINVGKTTLISTMYELLRLRRMERYRFAGSETLRGYEERCHLSRTASDNAKGDTQRTPTSAQLSFTHLRVAEGNGRFDLIFSDRSGEYFDEVLKRPAEIEAFKELERADITLLLIDLPALLKGPHVEMSIARRIFVAMEQFGLLDDRRVLLVGTKADEAAPRPRSHKASKALSALALDLQGRSKIGVIVKPLLVACRPRSGTTTIGEGIEALLAEIMVPQPQAEARIDAAWPRSMSELDRLMLPYRAKRT